MRAVIVNELGNLGAVGVAEVPEPTVGSDEVLIDVAAAAVNFPDLMMIAGTYQRRPDPPFVLGKDAAGTVVAVGESVTGFSAGDRVMAYLHHGAFAERVAAPAGQCLALPDDVDFEVAAAMGLTYQTAYMALVARAALKSGETILVTGAAGGVGLATVSLAKALGAATVLAGLTTPAKAGPVLKAGADHIIDLSVPALRDSVRQQVDAATGGRRIDVVVDMVGGDVFDACMRTLDWSGRMIVVGFAGGRIPEVRTNYLLIKNVAVLGLTIDSYYTRARDTLAAAHETLFELYRHGRIDPHIMASFRLEDVADALALVDRREVVGKAVLSIGRG